MSESASSGDLIGFDAKPSANKDKTTSNVQPESSPSPTAAQTRDDISPSSTLNKQNNETTALSNNGENSGNKYSTGFASTNFTSQLSNITEAFESMPAGNDMANSLRKKLLDKKFYQRGGSSSDQVLDDLEEFMTSFRGVGQKSLQLAKSVASFMKTDAKQRETIDWQHGHIIMRDEVLKLKDARIRELEAENEALLDGHDYLMKEMENLSLELKVKQPSKQQDNESSSTATDRHGVREIDDNFFDLFLDQFKAVSKSVIDLNKEYQVAVNDCKSLRLELEKNKEDSAENMRQLRLANRLLLSQLTRLDDMMTELTGSPSPNKHRSKVHEILNNTHPEYVLTELKEVTEATGFLVSLLVNLKTSPDQLSNPSNETILELKNKLAAKEEAVEYFKDGQKDYRKKMTDLRLVLLDAETELQATQEELSKVKSNYLAFLKKTMNKGEAKESALNQEAVSQEAVKYLDSAALPHETPSSKKKKEMNSIERALKRENLTLRRENRKARRVAGKVLHKNPVSESKHKRSKEREDNMAIMRIVKGSLAGAGSKESKLKEMLMDMGPIPTSSIKVISDDVAIIRTPEPFHNMPSYALRAFRPLKPMSLVHISSWHQLIVHNVPLQKVPTIYDMCVLLYNRFPHIASSGVYANNLACYPRMVNPLEFFSGKKTASFILCYNSKEVFNAALRWGITIFGEIRPLRTEPVVGYMKNPFNQAGFLIQFEPFSTIYGWPGDKKVAEYASSIEKRSAISPALDLWKKSSSEPNINFEL